MRIDVIVRAFLKPDKYSKAALQELVDKAKKNAEHIRKHSVSRVLFLVPTEHDYGGTEAALKEAFQGMFGISVIGASGQHSSGALNAAVEHVAADGATHVIFLSGKARQYFNADIAYRIAALFMDGEVAIGVCINELNGNQPVPFQNTFAAYDIAALQEAGGFTSTTDVEEMSVLVAFVRRGWGITVLPASEDAKLEVRQLGGGSDRYAQVMSEKTKKQRDELARVGSSAEEVNAGITML